MGREVYRRRIRGKGPIDLKSHPPKRREGEVLSVAKSPVVVISPTMRIYDAIEIMAKRGFRRLPVTTAGTRHLEGIVTATDIVDYLGGGEKFGIIQRKFGGNLFKAINEPIKLIMTRDVVSTSTLAKISEAIGTMKKSNLGGLPVVDAKKSVRAIITERDIMNLFANRISAVAVAQLMSKKVVTALPKTTIFEMEKTMTTNGFRRLPIVSEDKVMGIVTTMDIIRFFGLGRVFRYLRSRTIIQVLNIPALEIATRPVTTVTPNTDVGKASKIMREKDIGALPVVKNEKLVGIITERDFFKIVE